MRALLRPSAPVTSPVAAAVKAESVRVVRKLVLCVSAVCCRFVYEGPCRNDDWTGGKTGLLWVGLILNAFVLPLGKVVYELTFYFRRDDGEITMREREEWRKRFRWALVFHWREVVHAHMTRHSNACALCVCAVRVDGLYV